MDYDFVGGGDKLLSKKNIISFLILLIFAAAIPLGVKMAQTQQQLKSQAAGDELSFPTLRDTDSSSGLPVTKSPTFRVQVKSPFGPAASEVRSQ